MINLPIKALIGLGVAGAVGGGGYGIYVISRPAETIFDFLSKQQGVTVLKTDEAGDDTKWDEKTKQLESKSSALKGYTPSSKSETEAKNKENRDNLKNICKELLKSSSSDATKLSKAKEWCTKDKPSSQ